MQMSNLEPLSTKSAPGTRWPKYWSFSFCISPSNEYSGLISLGLTGLISLQSKRLKSLLHHHSLKASIFQCSVFFLAQFSYLYMTSGKTIALTIQTFVGKMIELGSPALQADSLPSGPPGKSQPAFLFFSFFPFTF